MTESLGVDLKKKSEYLERVFYILVFFVFFNLCWWLGSQGECDLQARQKKKICWSLSIFGQVLKPTFSHVQKNDLVLLNWSC